MNVLNTVSEKLDYIDAFLAKEEEELDRAQVYKIFIFSPQNYFIFIFIF